MNISILDKNKILTQTNILLDELLLNHLNEMILKYEEFDRAHNIEHVMEVVEASILKYIEYKDIYNLNLGMILTIAVYHDLGLGKKIDGLTNKEIRKNHHIYSKFIVLEDKELKKYFNEEEIIVIANAVEDHRASNSASEDKKARDIYGMIVSDADRTLVADTIIYRYLVPREAKNDLEESKLADYIDELMEAIYSKYNKETGYLKFYLNTSLELETERDKLIEIVKNRELFISKSIEIIENKKIRMIYDSF